MNNRVCLYLPPISGDYSGACSALFDLGGMICIHDAAGCTGNYTHFDEPRWYGSESMVYCTSLRKIDAILGDDEKFISRISEAAREMKPEFIAIVGSPVPNVIGFDFKGVARAISSRTGIPAFGFATAGIKGSYKDGIVMAVKAVTDYYIELNDGKSSKAGKKLNILGATPLDIPEENFEYLRSIFEERGYELRIPGNKYGSMDQIKDIEGAALNLAFTQSGLELAAYYDKKLGMPYLCGLPISKSDTDSYFERLEEVIKNKKSGIFTTRNTENENRCVRKACIIHDAVITSVIADLLEKKGIESEVCTLSGKTKEMAKLGIVNLYDEDKIIEKVNDEKIETVIADPLVLNLIETKKTKIALPHFAVSSRVCSKQNWNFFDEHEWELRLNAVQPHSLS